ncbi:hypothetical protein Hypma_013806 [Hypsizygus marmoreus]|uniref:Uncharacterized protein n=1 Tax=Hypsizygus marmoreus TaxID=39966 RepID=A0A369KBD9_HYPMA|nr:hypothetical protein Hypma_013806 [Hypsizygus marmoreus]
MKTKQDPKRGRRPVKAAIANLQNSATPVPLNVIDLLMSVLGHPKIKVMQMLVDGSARTATTHRVHFEEVGHHLREVTPGHEARVAPIPAASDDAERFVRSGLETWRAPRPMLASRDAAAGSARESRNQMFLTSPVHSRTRKISLRAEETIYSRSWRTAKVCVCDSK